MITKQTEQLKGLKINCVAEKNKQESKWWKPKKQNKLKIIHFINVIITNNLSYL